MQACTVIDQIPQRSSLRLNNIGVHRAGFHRMFDFCQQFFNHGAGRHTDDQLLIALLVKGSKRPFHITEMMVCPSSCWTM